MCFKKNCIFVIYYLKFSVLDSVIDLIQQMTQGEKSFFRRKHHANPLPNYIILYQTINKWKDRNEDYIKSKIDNLGMTNLAYVKHILLKNLLYSLTEYYREEKELNILHELDIIKILRRRGLMILASKKWENVYKQCLEEGHATYMELLLLEKWQLNPTGSGNTGIKEHQKLVEFSTKHRLAFQNLLHIRSLTFQFKYLVKKSNLLYNDDKKFFSELCAEFNSLPKEIKLYNDEYKILANLTESYIYFLRQEYLYALHVAEIIYEKIAVAEVYFFRHNEEFVLLFFKYYSELLFINNKISAIIPLLEVINNHVFINERNLIQRDIISFLIENKRLHKLYDYKKVEELYVHIKDKVDLWLKQIIPEWKSLFLGSIAISAFVIGEQKKALFYLYRYEFSYIKSFRKEIVSFFNLFSVVIAYEIDDDEIFETTYQKAYMHFYQYKEYEMLFEGFIKALRKAFISPSNEEEVILEEIIQNMQVLQKKKSSKLIFSYFDFHSWLQATKQKQSYAEYKQRFFGDLEH